MSFLLSTVALAWLVGPTVWTTAIAGNGPIARAKRRFDMWVGIAQWKDKRIKKVAKALDGPSPKARPTKTIP